MRLGPRLKYYTSLFSVLFSYLGGMNNSSFEITYFQIDTLRISVMLYCRPFYMQSFENKNIHAMLYCYEPLCYIDRQRCPLTNASEINFDVDG